MSGPPNAMMEPVGDLASLRFWRGSHRWRRRSHSGGGCTPPGSRRHRPCRRRSRPRSQAKADELIETQLKPRYIEPPPEDQDWNYIIDIWARWHRSFFQSRLDLRQPRPERPVADLRIARSPGWSTSATASSSLAYMRHTGKWWEVYRGLTADECLERVRDEGLFRP